jgi:hypothetical protein
MIDLNEKRQDIIAVATELFEKFVSMPWDVRSDNKERTGIQVLVWEPGTRNLVMVSIKEPSEAARFFAVEKAVRSIQYGHMSSENSADPDIMQFPGSVSIFPNNFSGIDEEEGTLTASVSGLKAEEDVAISVAILAKIVKSPFYLVCEKIIQHDGALPDWFCDWYYNKDNSYFQFLFE